jgi:HYDIN/CFA65/VesB-like, Ig-like domain/Cep192 domain 4
MRPTSRPYRPGTLGIVCTNSEVAVNANRLVRSSLLAVLLVFPGFASSQQVDLSPSSLKFDPQVVGSASATKDIVLTNSGNANLVVSSVAASGGYSVANNCSTVAPGASCTIKVSFISGLLGSASGIITITDNAATSPQLVNIAGSTLPPLEFSPATTSFGSVAVGTSSQSKSVTVINHGAAFSIRSIGVSGDYLQNNNCPATLGSGQSCTINVSFHPTTSGSIPGTLAITTMDPGFDFPLTGFTSPLSGMGVGTVATQVSLQPSRLNFKIEGAFDFSSRTRKVILSNTSPTSSLTVQSVSISGPIASGTPLFRIQSTTCGGMLSPGGTCQITVAIGPPGGATTFPVKASGAVTIVDSDVTSPRVISLSANLSPEVTFAPSQLQFDPQDVGTTSAPKVITVRNNLDLSGVSLLPLTVSGDFSAVPAGTKPCGNQPALEAGDICTLGITFTPNRVGAINGALTLTLYPECDPEAVLILHKPCPNAQVIGLVGTGK